MTVVGTYRNNQPRGQQAIEHVPETGPVPTEANSIYDAQTPPCHRNDRKEQESDAKQPGSRSEIHDNRYDDRACEHGKPIHPCGVGEVAHKIVRVSSEQLRECRLDRPPEPLNQTQRHYIAEAVIQAAYAIPSQESSLRQRG